MYSRDAPVNKQSAESFPPQLMELSLQNRLRVIGQQLDKKARDNASLMEVAGGFLVRVCNSGDPNPRVYEFKDEDFPKLIRESLAQCSKARRLSTHSSLMPTGYEDSLRALGYELDQLIAENVVITEFVSFITVTGVGPVLENGTTVYRTFSHAVNALGIQKLLAAAVARGDAYSPTTTNTPESEHSP